MNLLQGQSRGITVRLSASLKDTMVMDRDWLPAGITPATFCLPALSGFNRCTARPRSIWRIEAAVELWHHRMFLNLNTHQESHKPLSKTSKITEEASRLSVTHREPKPVPEASRGFFCLNAWRFYASFTFSFHTFSPTRLLAYVCARASYFGTCVSAGWYNVSASAENTRPRGISITPPWQPFSQSAVCF